MTIDDLKCNARKLEGVWFEIEQNRKNWPKARHLLITTLERVKDAFDLDWYVQERIPRINSNVVNIRMNDIPSGIMEENENKARHLIKKGGELAFSQAYNGKIFVFIHYPSIEGVIERRDEKILCKVRPEKITSNFILEKVSEFLDEMTKWEKGEYKRYEIGYFKSDK